MCLLIVASSNTLRTTLLDTPHLLHDIFQHNKDGLGVMYATASRGLKVSKRLPQTLADVRAAVEKLPQDDREVAVHFRMRTHGDVDLANCHPYPVSQGVALMHNGILHTGNAADKTKSDTWHFVRDYLATLGIDALHDAGFAKMLGDFIDSNRFAIMSGDGRCTVINREQGIEHGGVWFSNTYAWSPELLIPTYKKPVPRSMYPYAMGSGWGNYPKWYERDESIFDDVAYDDPQPQAARGDEDEAVFNAVIDYDVEAMADLLEFEPTDTLRSVLAQFKVERYERVGDEDLTAHMMQIREAWVDSDVTYLAHLCTRGGGVTVAEVLSYYCEVTERTAVA